MDHNLAPFFHKDTLREIKNLRRLAKTDDSHAMNYIMLTALSRLYGHSKGFFCVYISPVFYLSRIAKKKQYKAWSKARV